MSAKANSKKGDKMMPPQGVKITSFFTRAPPVAAANNPKLEKASADVISPAKDVVQPTEKCTPASKVTSPNTASSGAKTTMTGKNNKRRRMLGSDSEEQEEEEDCVMKEGGAIPTGSSLAHEAIMAAKEAKASASKVGDLVEVQGENGAWENGKLVRHNISGTWMVQTDSGKRTEVSIPSNQIRSVNGKAASQTSDAVMQEEDKDDEDGVCCLLFVSVSNWLAQA
jgi:hypothetical protein